MQKKLIKLICFILIFNLFFIRGFVVFESVYGQSQESPTSAPQPTSIPSVLKSESSEKPTSAPQPTSPLSTSPVINTSTPTSSPQEATNPSPTNGINSTNFPLPDPSPTVVSSDTSGTQNTSNNSSSPSVSGPPEGSSSSNSGEATNGSVNDPVNIATGPFSNNYAAEINKKVEEVVNKNLADMENKIAAISSTGFNYANLNTLDGQVMTGDSVSSLNLLNKLNSNMTGLGGFSVFNINDNYAGDIVLKLADGTLSGGFSSAAPTISKNNLTGPGSNNIADAQNSFKVNEINGNDAKLVNDLVLQANTGGNTASFNTGGGSVKTGNATALANVVNLANTNLNVSKWLIGVVNIFGTLAGNIILPKDTSGPPSNSSPSVLAENNKTGFSSNNTANYDNASTTNITNDNTAKITSNLDVTANTGNNTASVNTGGGSVNTGESQASVSNTTIANSNTVKENDTVWMVIVNEMGKWVGHIIGAPWESKTASNSLPLNNTTNGQGQQSYSVLAQNSGTGPLSNNEANYSQKDETSISNNNSADVVNNIKASSDTGNNEASYNTGAGQVESGNAQTGVNLVNMVNTNITAKNFVALIVNVLGTFLGDVIPPDQKANSQVANNSGSGTSNLTANQVLSLPTPTPTVIQLASFNMPSSNIGGVESVPSYSVPNNNASVQYFAPPVNQVYYQKKNLAQVIPVRNLSANSVDSQLIQPRRGLFLSQAFAKATESSLPGMLLGGATFKVTSTWLSVVPIAILLILLRRRKKINISKYFYHLVDLIL